MRYLNADPAQAPDEAGYDVVDGVVVDSTEAHRPNTRRFGEFTRWYQKTKDELAAEELAWAARSGPVRIIRPARREVA